MKINRFVILILMFFSIQSCSVLTAVGTVALDTLECAAGVDCVASHQEEKMTYQQREAARLQAQMINKSFKTNNRYGSSTSLPAIQSCKINPYGKDGKLRCGCGGTCAQ